MFHDVPSSKDREVFVILDPQEEPVSAVPVPTSTPPVTWCNHFINTDLFAYFSWQVPTV
jgi:hypothetical protein